MGLEYSTSGWRATVARFKALVVVPSADRGSAREGPRTASADLRHPSLVVWPARASTRASSPSSRDRRDERVRRNSLDFASLLLVLLVLVGGLGAVLWQAREARLEAARARAVKDFLVGILGQPGVSRSDSLETGADWVRRELKDRPDVRNALLIELGGLQTQLDAHAKAEVLYRELLTAAEAEHGPRSLDAADARVHLARSLRDQQRYAEADGLLIQAAADADGPGERRASIRGRSLVTRCEISSLVRTLEGPEGLRTAEEAVRLLERSGNSPDVVDSLYALARMHESLGQLAEAAEITGRGLSVAEAARAGAGDRISRGRQMRARMLLAMGRYTEGEAEISRAADQLLSSAGENQRHTVEAREQQAVYLERRGAHVEAIPLLRETLVLLRELHTADDPLSIQSEVDLGTALVRAGRETEADELLSGTARLRTQPARAHSLAAAQLAHGRALALLGDTAAAAKAYEESRALRAKERGEGDVLTGPPLLGLAEVALQQGALDNAERLLSSATARLAPADGAKMEDRRQAEVDAAVLTLARTKPVEALAEARKVVSETEVDPERPYLHTVESAALVLVARSELALGHSPEAVTPAGRAVELRRQTQWEGSPLLVEARLLFAEALAGSGDASRAREVLSEARAGAALQPRAARPFQAELERVSSLTEGPR
jgi:serine/threonine-protein kinase